MVSEPDKNSPSRFRKKRIGIFIVGVLLAAAVWLVVASRDSMPMPVYEGKTARQWMYGARDSDSSEVAEAFREMGSNAVPFWCTS